MLLDFLGLRALFQPTSTAVCWSRCPGRLQTAFAPAPLGYWQFFGGPCMTHGPVDSIGRHRPRHRLSRNSMSTEHSVFCLHSPATTSSRPAYVRNLASQSRYQSRNGDTAIVSGFVLYSTSTVDDWRRLIPVIQLIRSLLYMYSRLPQLS